MSEVFIYDDTLSPVSSSNIDIEERDSRGVLVQLQPNTAQPSGLYGAIMKLPSPMGPVGFWVDDTGGTYAPTGLEFLNPSLYLRLDVTLFPLPAPVGSGSSGGGGGGGRNNPVPIAPDDVAALSTRWTHEENKGVARLLATVVMARMVIEPDRDFIDRIHRWEGWLEELSVDVPRARGGQGGSGPGTPLKNMHIIPEIKLGYGNILRIPMEER